MAQSINGKPFYWRDTLRDVIVVLGRVFLFVLMFAGLIFRFVVWVIETCVELAGNFF